MNIKKYNNRNIIIAILSMLLVVLTDIPVLAATTTSLFPVKNITINEGDNYSFDKIDAEITSLNDNIATVKVGEDITVTGINQGTAKIKARKGNNVSTCKVKVLKPSLKLNTYMINLYLDIDKNIKSKIKPTIKGLNKKVTFSAENSGILDVAENGNILGLSEGTTKVFVEANNMVVPCVVNVLQPELVLNKSDMEICVSKNKKLNNQAIGVAKIVGPSNKIKWTSSNTKVAKVDGKGVVTAVSDGEAIITAKANGITQTCEVTVYKKDELLINCDSVLYVGKTYPIKCNSDDANIISSDVSILTVNEDKTLTPLKEGKVTITANSELLGNYLKTVEVKELTTEIEEVDLCFAYNGKAMTYPLSFTVDGPSSSYTFTTSNKNVATVSKTGVLTLKAPGTCEITLKANDLESKINVKIDNNLTLNYNSFNLYVGDKATLKSSIKKTVYSIADTNVAAIDSKGVITALDNGNTVITAEAEGLTKTCVINVIKPDIIFDTDETFVQIGEKEYLSYDIIGRNQSAKISVDNPSIVSIDKKGYIKGTALGSTTINLTANNMTSKHRVTVTECRHEFNEAVTVRPTCIESGKSLFVCNKCGFKYEGITKINKSTHVAYTERIIKEPSCKEEGIRNIICTGCGLVIQSAIIPKTPHIYQWVDKGGKYYKVCGACGEYEFIHPSKDKSDNTHVHNFTDWNVSVEPTCTSDGKKVRTCYCGYEESEVLKTEHNYNDLDRCVYCNSLNAGLFKDGVKVMDFSEIESAVKTDYESANINDINSDVLLAKANTIKYSTLDGKIKVVELPSNHISSIINEKGIDKVVLPEGIDNIGKHSFAFCNTLKEVVMPNSLAGIAYGIFYNSTELEKIVYKDTVYTDGEALVKSARNNDVEVYVNAFTNTKNFSKHNFAEPDVVTESSCITTGVSTRTCLSCAYCEFEIVPAVGHKFGDLKVITNPTCTEEGLKFRKCEVCGEAMDLTKIEPVGHEMGDWFVEKKPTCFSNGRKVRLCINCGTEMASEDIIEKIEHTWVEDKDKSKAPTCTEVGHIVYKCKIEGCDATKEEPIKELGHALGEDVIENKVEPTCTTGGRYDKVNYCTRCSTEDKPVVAKTETITLNPLGHDFELFVLNDSTCKREGNGYEKCKRCSAKGEDITIPIKEHKYDKKSPSKATFRCDATCQKGITYYYACSICGDINNKDFDNEESYFENSEPNPINHEWKKKGGRVYKEATCTEVQKCFYDCSLCGSTENTSSTYIGEPALGHKYDKEGGSRRSTATCNNKATYYYICSRCDDKENEILYYEAGEYASHRYNYEVNIQPTCKTAGCEYKRCEFCREWDYNDGITLQALGHDWIVTGSGKYCDRCGETKK